MFGEPEPKGMTDEDYELHPFLRRTPFWEEMSAAGRNWFERSWMGDYMAEARIAEKEGGPGRMYEKFYGRGAPGLLSTGIAGEMLYTEDEPEPPPVLTRNEWQESEWHRPEIPWRDDMTEARAEILSELHDEQTYRDSLLARSPGGFSRGAGRLVTGLAVTALDPVNYIPIFGPAARGYATARLGIVGGRAALAAGEAAIATAVTEPVVVEHMREIGDHLSWKDALADITLAGTVGALFGTGSGILARRRGRAGQALRKAVLDHLNGDPVDVAPVLKGHEGLEGLNFARIPDAPEFLSEPKALRPEVRPAEARPGPDEELPEMDLVERMQAEGKLIETDEYNERTILDEAKREQTTAAREAEAWRVAAECLIAGGL